MLACDFFVIVTASFRLVYVFVVLEVGPSSVTTRARGIANVVGKTATGERFTANQVGSLRRYRNIPRFQPPADPPRHANLRLF